MWTKEELAYVAGLFEGEGCCRSFVANNGRNPNAFGYQITIEMASQYPLEKVAGIMGFGILSGPRKRPNPKWQDLYRYSISNFEQVQAFLVAIWPWLSPYRKYQICNCLNKEYLDYWDYEDILS